MFRSDATVVFVITGSSVSVVSILRPLDDAAELSESPRRSKLFSLLDGIKRNPPKLTFRFIAGNSLMSRNFFTSVKFKIWWAIILILTLKRSFFFQRFAGNVRDTFLWVTFLLISRFRLMSEYAYTELFLLLFLSVFEIERILEESPASEKTWS